MQRVRRVARVGDQIANTPSACDGTHPLYIGGLYGWFEVAASTGLDRLAENSERAKYITRRALNVARTPETKPRAISMKLNDIRMRRSFAEAHCLP